MSDGNTAIQVSPVPTESEMAQASNVFERAKNSIANAITQASDLSNQVTELSAKVSELTRAVDTIRSQNQWLDEQLTTVRQQRDQAITEGRQAAHDRDEARNANEALTNRINDQDALIVSLRGDLTRARDDRDHAGMRVLELEDENAKLKDKLAEAAGWASSIQAMLSPPKPVVEPQPSAAQYGNIEAIHDPMPSAQAEPQPSAQPDWLTR